MPADHLRFLQRRTSMAKKRRRKYSRGSGEEVRREMHRYKRGRAKSGRGGKGGKVKSRNKRSPLHCPRHVRKERKFPERSAEPFSRGMPRKTSGLIEKAARRSSGTAKSP